MINYLIDIDDTITLGAKNEEVEKMPHAIPFKGAVKTINRWYDEGCNITFFTSRTEDMRFITETWIKKWGFKYHSLLMNKPRGGNYYWIDNLDVTAVKYPDHFQWDDDYKCCGNIESFTYFADPHKKLKSDWSSNNIPWYRKILNYLRGFNASS